MSTLLIFHNYTYICHFYKRIYVMPIIQFLQSSFLMKLRHRILSTQLPFLLNINYYQPKSNHNLTREVFYFLCANKLTYSSLYLRTLVHIINLPSTVERIPSTCLNFNLKLHLRFIICNYGKNNTLIILWLGTLVNSD